MPVATPTLAELREVCQPQAKIESRNGEHWAGRLYMRRLSLRATRHLVRTSVSPNTLTWMMVVAGVGAGAALLIPGVAGALLAALLFQAFLFFDCVDGEVARWKQQFSAVGVYVDRLGAYLADAALLVGAGFRVAETASVAWISVGMAAALGIVLLKASTDLVDVARTRSGLGTAATEESTEIRSTRVNSVRRLAAAFKIHRIANGIEASLLFLVAALVELGTGGHAPTQIAVAAVAVVAWLMVPAHLFSILSSSRLR
jgi:phosphatidylglycerophosphate synthase